MPMSRMASTRSASAERAQPLAHPETWMLPVNGEAAIQIFPDGHFKITNGVSELISLTQQLAQQCAEMTTNTIFGPMPPNNFAEFVDIALELESLVGE